MPNNNFGKIFILSVFGSLLTAFSFATAAKGKFSLDTLRLPGVVEITFFSGVIYSIPLTFFMYWSLKNKNLFPILPIIYLIVSLATILLCYLSQKWGFIGAFLIWAALLLFARHFDIGGGSKE